MAALFGKSIASRSLWIRSELIIGDPFWVRKSLSLCSLLGPSVQRILQARILKWLGCYVLQGIFQTQGLKLHLRILHWQAGTFFTTDSAIKLLGIYPEKTIIEKDTFTPILL